MRHIPSLPSASLWLFLALSVEVSAANFQNSLRRHRIFGPSKYYSLATPWGVGDRYSKLLSSYQVIPRGGASSSTSDSEEDEYDEEEYDDAEEYDDEYDEESEEEEEEEVAVTTRKSKATKTDVTEYDEPLVASPMLNLYATIGVMLFSKRVNLFDPIVVKCARAAFIGYLVIQQLFVLYVRIQAKLQDDQTTVTVTNPLSSVLQSQLSDKGGDSGGGNGMMKNLASSFLSSELTIQEYDLKQARSMQSGLVMNMLFMWFLHFKMNQVQPLIIQSVTGLLQFFYSPLFQVYGLGRNLPRPFPNPAMARMEEAASAAENNDDDEEKEMLAEDAAAILEKERLEEAATVEEESEESEEETEADDDNDATVEEEVDDDEAESAAAADDRQSSDVDDDEAESESESASDSDDDEDDDS